MGVVLAFLFHRGLLALVANKLPVPRLDQVSLDLTVVVLTMGLSLVTGLLFGLLPAFVSSHRLNDALREGGRHGGGRRAQRVLGVLAAAEVALSLVLLTGAGLLVRSFVRLSSIDPGFRANGLLTMRVQLPATRYDTPNRSSGFYSNVLTRIAALPGVQSTAGITFPPMTGGGIGTSFWRTDQPTPGPGQAPSTDVRPVTPGFFHTMGIPHVMGRDFTASDRDDSPAVVIVNETLVRQHFADENPIGKRLHINIGPVDRLDYEVVGVVGDIKLAIGPSLYNL
jgi:putative ABC transport system permease protein